MRTTSRSENLVVDTVEVHAHVIPEAIMGAAGPHGPEVIVKEGGGYTFRAGQRVLNASTVAHKKFEQGQAGGEDPTEWFSRLSDPARRLTEMTAKGISSMVISPAPPLYMYSIEPSYAVPFSRTYNDALAEFCTSDPDRLFFLAHVALQEPAEAAKELERAVGSLGARGIYIGATDIGGRELDDPDLRPVFAAAASAGVPVSIHPGPSAASASGEHDCYHERLAVGFPAQETQAIYRLIAGGVLDDFPDLKIYMSHGGGFFPYQAGRLAAFLEIAGDSKAKRTPLEYMNQLYFDFIVHDPRARRLLVDVAGVDHVLFGSNYAGMDSVDGNAFLRELDLVGDELSMIAGRNARELFSLPAEPVAP